MLFTAHTPAAVVDACFADLQDESYRAYLDMMVFALPRPARIHTPMLVLGGELDRVFTVAEVRATARAYRTEAEIFAGMGHDLMLDGAGRRWPTGSPRGSRSCPLSRPWAGTPSASEAGLAHVGRVHIGLLRGWTPAPDTADVIRRDTIPW